MQAEWNPVILYRQQRLEEYGEVSHSRSYLPLITGVLKC